MAVMVPPEYNLPTDAGLSNEPLNERVQVYVRVRPIFKHELLEDMEAVQTMK